MLTIRDEVQIAHIPAIKIATLGPSGTSSEYVTKKFIMNYFPDNLTSHKIILYETFEKAMGKLVEGSLNYVICPHAYHRINEFYMNPLICLVEIFQCDTPMYGIATRQDYQFKDYHLEEQVIVSHPAPLQLIRNYLGKEPQFSIVDSTSIAAELVANKTYNIAITNEEAAKKFNLKFVHEFNKIPMSWSLFGRKM